jgi:hypothetical protein
MGRAVRWLAAVVVGVGVFEGLDALAVPGSAIAWLTLASPFIAGAVAGWGAGGGMASQLLAAAAMVWARIGADRIIGAVHGVRRPLELEIAVVAIFGLPWMGMAITGGIVGALARRRVRT